MFGVGFWTAYMGIYGGGGEVAAVPPTIPGAELRLSNERTHFCLTDDRTHYRLSNTRMHYVVTEET